MRKLLLASFTHKPKGGVIHYEESRLIAVECNQNEPDHKVTEFATNVLKTWFDETHPTGELLSYSVHPTIDGTKPLQRGQEVRYSQEYLAHELNELPPVADIQLNISRIMVIDLNGHRKHFQLAHYDFDHQMWIFHNDQSMLEKDHAKWMNILPIA